MIDESLRVLEYPKIRQLLSRYALTELGGERALHLSPLEQIGAVRQSHQRIAEMTALLERGESLPLHGAAELQPIFQELRIAGNVLLAETFLKVAAAVEAAHNCRSFLLEREVSALRELGERLVRLPEVSKAIRRCIDLRGDIVDGASFELQQIRGEARGLRERIRARLEALLNADALAQAFQERYVTQRNGRYVIPVRADHRGRVKGFVHDESASGQTLFIEPAFVLDDNNRLQSLLRQEKREEERILRELTEKLREQLPVLRSNQETLADLDLVAAAARFAAACGGTAPALTEKPLLELRQARHPLLLFSADGVPRPNPPVPIDLFLGEKNDTLIISGPNTGGKSVALKTAGLLLLMARSGLFIPCSADSRLFLFPKIFADIGDEQSIEANLSTFSGHLQRMKWIMEEAGEDSLVLLDEAGTGTDPSEGGALAMAFLDGLRAQKAKVILSTHLNLLKSYAFLNEGVENAAVEFDAATLQPTYRLHYGLPGASNAFSIARLLGLPREVLAKAAGYLGQEERAGFDLVAALNQKRWEMERQAAAMHADREEAQRNRERSRLLVEQLEREKEELLARLLNEGRKRVRETEKELKRLLVAAAADHPDTRRQAALKGELNALRKGLEEPAISKPLPGPAPEEIRPGQLLRIRGLDQEAEVVGLHGEEVELTLHGKRLRLPLNRLERGGKPRTSRRSGEKRVRSRVTRETFSTELKLVGQRVDDAIPQLQRFLDDALLHGLEEVSVVHGSGEGVLRRAIRDYLGREREVKSFYSADPAHGGDNVTIIRFAG
ncbi:MAG: endonuclease MutS2 [Deltaproteobacteria bacterium]|nr:endonuclease MutS2 [Deltaproteobacteria bacterium]